VAISTGRVAAAGDPLGRSMKPMPRDAGDQFSQHKEAPLPANPPAVAPTKTTSKRFANNVWTMLKHMDNVENVKGQGYRLNRLLLTNPLVARSAA
jgi:hypothetical protein